MDQLQLATSLFEHMTEQGVGYVHWKSNEHLDDAVMGRTDLDLLVDPNTSDVFRHVARDLGFVPMLAPPERALPGVESVIGFDHPTGTLLHLDVHFQLVLGERYVKNHHLPLESWLLENKRTIGDVPVPEARHEFLLLYVRSMLKTSTRQLVAAAAKRQSPLPDRIEQEAKWLSDQVSDQDARQAAQTSDIGISENEILRFKTRIDSDRVEWRYVWSRKISLKRRLRRYQRQSRSRVLLKKVGLRVRSYRWVSRLGFGIRRRHLPPPAPVIAVVGADGSGKSRLTRDLEAWLGTKLRVRHIYFGQPKSGILWKLLNKPGSLLRHRQDASQGGLATRFLGIVAPVSDALKWTVLARRREQMARSAADSARKGVLVIEERFPLSHFWDMEYPMDGPRLQGRSSGLTGVLARVELGHYQKILQPDLTLVLDADVETLRARKIDLTYDEHIAKVNAVSALKSDSDTAVFDATLPYEEVLLETKTAIWERIDADH